MDSKLVVIVSRAGSNLQANELFAGLRGNGFAVEEFKYNGAEPESFYRRIAREYLDEVEILVSGEGVPAREFYEVAPNLRTVVTTDPAHRDTSHFNGRERSANVQYIAYDGASHFNTTKRILKYLAGVHLAQPASVPPNH